MRSPHHLHGVLDVAPLPGLVRIAPPLARQGMLGRLGDSRQAVLFKHLPRDRVNLHLGYHDDLPHVPLAEAAEVILPAVLFKPPKRSLVPLSAVQNLRHSRAHRARALQNPA
jgi:hypothetical protein